MPTFLGKDKIGAYFVTSHPRLFYFIFHARMLAKVHLSSTKQMILPVPRESQVVAYS